MAILVAASLFAPAGVETRGPAAAEVKNLPAKQTSTVAARQKPTAASKSAVDGDAVELVEDDGKTLWDSPTHGKPIRLAYLAPGAQFIVVVRPSALGAHPEGAKVRSSLGPLGERGVKYIEHVARMSLADIERLTVGCQAKSDGAWVHSLVVRSMKPISREALLAKLSSAAEKEHNGARYWLSEDRAYYLPKSDDHALVIAPADSMADIIDLADEPPPLRRDIERLLEHTDSDRHLTIVVAPNSLFSEGKSMFSGEMTRLRQPLFWFLGDELSAAALSANWDDNFFVELVAVPTLDTSAERAARILVERLAQIPDDLEAYVVGMDPNPYGRLVVARFPAMVRKLATYTRSGFEKDCAVLNCYLPGIAGHNLVMGAELTLAEPAGIAGAAVDSSTPPADAVADASAAAATPETATVEERLARVTSLRFARDTLEAALEQLANDIGVKIVIRGADLQADGITKNQSFGINIENKPAHEILVEILRLANPDKTATSASDSRQKLVYIVAPTEPGGAEEIAVTTRARATERKDKLPAVFELKEL
jgi:hypothetical protein